MAGFDPRHGIGTLVNHVGEGIDPLHAHTTPIYETSTFSFSDVAEGAALFEGKGEGYIYSRLGNPNQAQLANKIAALEGLDLLRAQPTKALAEVVEGRVFASGMAAITSGLLARIHGGQTLIAQRAIYSATHHFLSRLAPQYGIKVVWVEDYRPNSWEKAFAQNPEARVVYTETPVNPTMTVVDLAAVAEIAHAYQAWLMVDNTFATPYCQRPLTLGADVVMHSTTKYLSGHGLVVGGALVSRHLEYVRKDLKLIMDVLGGTQSPFDAWLASIGLRTFELRMQRHCENAMQVARFLEGHPAVARVYYPGLESHPDYELAGMQMVGGYGGMMSFELKGGMEAGVHMMNHVHVCTLAVSLGNTNTLISHPASMSHSNVKSDERLSVGITDGLVRFSVGVENVEDVIADLDQAMSL